MKKLFISLILGVVLCFGDIQEVSAKVFGDKMDNEKMGVKSKPKNYCELVLLENITDPKSVKNMDGDLTRKV